MSITTTVNTDDIVAQIEAIEQRFREAIRPAAFAGAKVYYAEVMMRVPKRTGLLASSIYIAFSDENSQDNQKATYHVSWNKKQAYYGHFVEFGTSKMAARPFLRPAYEAAKGRAEAEMKRVLQEAVNGSGN